MSVFGEIEEILGELYPYRWPIGIGLVLVATLAAWWGYQRGWHLAIARHPRRSAVTAFVVLAVGLSVGYDLLSPLWTRTELYEADPLAGLVVPAGGEAEAAGAPESDGAATGAVNPSGFAPRLIAEGTFAGADDFHFGEGTARLVETAPGLYVVRFEEFSVRNGPDLFVYLSPAADGYADSALNLGELKATDGAFNYEVPTGTDVSEFQSVIVWCKQFGVLFATAPLAQA
jgi:hypothetical protein